MNAEQTFTNVDDKVLVKLISQASQRVMFVAPGLRKVVADALAEALLRLPGKVTVVLDVDAEVCRLGYGDEKGLVTIKAATEAAGTRLYHQQGVRIGLLIADDTTIIYSPVPLLIEAGSPIPNKPNAIILNRTVPAAIEAACGLGAEPDGARQIGLDFVKEATVEAVKEDLKATPPKPYNVSRIERVFSSMLHYVELTIEDYKLTTRSMLLNPELFGVRNAEVVRRLTNRYHLFSETDALTVEIPHIGDDAKPDPQKPKEKFGPLSIDRERNRIKKRFVIEAGNFGSLMLRRDVTAFEKEIVILRAKIDAYQKAVQEQIKKRTDEIVNELLTALLERLKAEPPEHWQSRFFGKKPSDDDIKRLFQQEVQSEVNRVKADFAPKVFTIYKDVTYQTFKDPKFRELMEDRFGKEAIARIFREYDAAPEN